MYTRFTKRSKYLMAIIVYALSLASPAAAQSSVEFKKMCLKPTDATKANCFATVRADGVGRNIANASPVGFTPTQLRSAYGLTLSGKTTKVAIITAYDNPNIISELATYSQAFGLPTANIQKVNQRGGAALPRADAGWGVETSLDVQIVHGVCPTCSILLVEADSPTFTNLGSAINTSVSLGATVVSNSYGASEFSSERNYDSYYTKPGIAIVASAGDSGYGTEYPAASPGVIAVGGTSLRFQNGAYTETAWSGTGSGCSRYEPKPIWQHDTGCGRRSISDISAVADPNTGAAIYSTSSGGWITVGGTSLSAPIISGAIGLAGSSTAQAIYSHTSSIKDIVSGRNAYFCYPSYLCNSTTGYDGPTGLGTPKSLSAF